QRPRRPHGRVVPRQRRQRPAGNRRVRLPGTRTSVRELFLSKNDEWFGIHSSFVIESPFPCSTKRFATGMTHTAWRAVPISTCRLIPAFSYAPKLSSFSPTPFFAAQISPA